MSSAKNAYAPLLTFLMIAASTSGASADQPGWQHEPVDLRMPGGQRIRGIRYPADQPLPIARREADTAGRRVRRTLVPPDRAARLRGPAEGATGPILALTIDSPPIDGFVPWIAMVASNERLGELELDAVPTTTVGGTTLHPDPMENQFAIGILDTGAGASVIGNANATTLGLFGANLVSNNTIEVTGVTGSVEARVSEPIGVFMAGLDSITGGLMDTTDVAGATNFSVLVGQTPPVGQPDLVTAIGTPLAVFYTSAIHTDEPLTVSHGGDDFTGPRVEFFEQDDPNIPQYPNLIPLELRPLGSISVQYIPCLDILGGCSGGFDTPSAPSVLIGISSQSLFFVSSVDMAHEGEEAIDRDRFMFDTGAQVTVVGTRIAARLRLDPAQPDFEVDIEGVTGDVVIRPGFYVDAVDIPALGQWLSLTNVPVVYLDVASPEGGTLDGIIGMNLFTQANFILRGGGFSLGPDPTVEFAILPPEIVDVDYDNDGDVDQDDFGHFQVCVSGSGVTQTEQACLDAMLDGDADVDLDDFGMFQTCQSGPTVPADPNCTSS